MYNFPFQHCENIKLLPPPPWLTWIASEQLNEMNRAERVDKVLSGQWLMWDSMRLRPQKSIEQSKKLHGGSHVFGI